MAHSPTTRPPLASRLRSTTLFAEYTSMLERYIAEHISTRLPDFDMAAFCAELREVCRCALLVD